MLTFAIIGGGIFVYRSFAATLYSWPYGRGFYPYATSQKGNGCGAAANNDKDPFGNTVPIISLLCAANTSSSSYVTMASQGASIVADRNAINGVGNQYRACIDLKGSAAISVGIDNGGNPAAIQGIQGNFTYGNLQCGPAITATKVGSIRARVDVFAQNNGQGSFVNVRNVQLQRVN